MRSLLARMGRASIWGADSIPATARLYARSRRIYMPLAHVLTILGGVVASANGIPTIDNLFPGWVADGVAILFALTGLAALIGEAFPRLWRVEMYSLCLTAGLLTGYAMALMFRVIGTTHVPGATSGSNGAGFVAVLAVMVLVLPIIRIDVLVVEERVRRILAGIEKQGETR